MFANLDKPRKTILVIEMSCPSERNIQSKELEKTEKYRELLDISVKAHLPRVYVHNLHTTHNRGLWRFTNHQLNQLLPVE